MVATLRFTLNNSKGVAYSHEDSFVVTHGSPSVTEYRENGYSNYELKSDHWFIVEIARIYWQEDQGYQCNFEIHESEDFYSEVCPACELMNYSSTPCITCSQCGLNYEEGDK